MIDRGEECCSEQQHRSAFCLLFPTVVIGDVISTLDLVVFHQISRASTVLCGHG